jgi:hypothetical protein
MAALEFGLWPRLSLSEFQPGALVRPVDSTTVTTVFDGFYSGMLTWLGRTPSGVCGGWHTVHTVRTVLSGFFISMDFRRLPGVNLRLLRARLRNQARLSTAVLQPRNSRDVVSIECRGMR